VSATMNGVFCGQCGQYHASLTVCPNWKMLGEAVAAKQPAPQGFHTEPVCNCHDCTQARSLLGKAWLIEILERIEREIKGTNTGMFKTYDAVARIEQSQATLASTLDEMKGRLDVGFVLRSDTYEIVAKAQAKAAGLCPPRRGKVRGDRGRKR
jgi:hypothetical protein